MSSEIIPLASLEFIPYLNPEGCLEEDWLGKIGVYAIFNAAQTLEYIGYSRDIYLSLKQHLVRQPQSCYWVKMQIVNRPSRTFLEEIRQAWLAENQVIPAGNSGEVSFWTEAIDAKTQMSAEERQAYLQAEELQQIKILKGVARRLEAQILETLKSRGVGMEIRFNPKLKEEGLLDVNYPR
jgi:hypothetical protein